MMNLKLDENLKIRRDQIPLIADALFERIQAKEKKQNPTKRFREAMQEILAKRR